MSQIISQMHLHIYYYVLCLKNKVWTENSQFKDSLTTQDKGSSSFQ